jgi:hypothetical protein
VAVVSEPPWTNKASGTASKNGTTSHTINFGFTSASGSLLVAIVHGAVTNTASGWTKQAGPVATGECTLFTKTSAGDTSITVTHNGSDYAVNYVIYEFPAGSSVTGVDSTTGSNDTMVGLTGLPGTEQVVIGALGRVAIGSETGASISPSAPWVEDGDLFVAATGTDGSYLAVVHQINYTGTSITPTISPTYTGTWSNSSREKISAAFDVAVGASTVNGTASVTGAGVTSAAAVQQATATVAGAGTTSAAVRQQAGGTVTGAGSTSAAVVQRATAAVTGAGSTTASAAGTTSGTATVTGAGAVTALATQRTVATVTGAGSTSATGSVIVPGSATITGAGAVTALVWQAAGSTVIGAGQVTATSAGQIISGTATVLGVGFVIASPSSRITPRPNSGITSRPNTGITIRP